MPSEREGFGHSINEGRAAGAQQALYTDSRLKPLLRVCLCACRLWFSLAPRVSPAERVLRGGQQTATLQKKRWRQPAARGMLIQRSSPGLLLQSADDPLEAAIQLVLTHITRVGFRLAW
jgi:hypothetical protein